MHYFANLSKNHYCQKYDKIVCYRYRDSKSEIKIPALFLLECANCLVEGLCKHFDISGSYEGKNDDSYVYYKNNEWFIVFLDDYSSEQYCSTLLISSLWQRLCPSVIAVLGTPISTKVNRGSGRMQGQMGRGSGTSSLPHQLFSSPEAKVIYSLSCNLVVAMGTVGEMRPVLESLLHRMLLYPPPTHRQDSLRAVAEVSITQYLLCSFLVNLLPFQLLKNPIKLIQLAGPIVYPDPRNLQRCDLSLFQL